MYYTDLNGEKHLSFEAAVEASDKILKRREEDDFFTTTNNIIEDLTEPEDKLEEMKKNIRMDLRKVTPGLAGQMLIYDPTIRTWRWGDNLLKNTPPVPEVPDNRLLLFL